jgi:Protein of unknown function (DUF2785)
MKFPMLAMCLITAPTLAAPCPPTGQDRVALDSLKAREFAVPDDAERQALALALVPCLAHPDPQLRDGIAFEAYSTWLRAKRLDLRTRGELLQQLTAMLQPDANDRDGFRQPFAALVLSEVARTDRIEAWMTATQRNELVDQAVKYLGSVKDYRGFDQRDGWRHGVAHGSDIVTQLVLNSHVDRAGVDRLLAAVAAQVAPAGEHAYVDGESERLARAVLVAAQRGLHSTAEWEQWLLAVSRPAPLPDWGSAYRTRAGLAKRHNLMGFLNALYVNARESGNENAQRLVPGLQAAYQSL